MSAAPDLSRIPPDPFEWALDFVLGWEGSKYTETPGDRGGATKYGITLGTLQGLGRDGDLDHDGDVDREDVKLMTRSVAGLIYRARYWNVVQGGEIAAVSPNMALCVFDAAVQSGPGTAAMTFQRVAQSTPDGVIGKVTLACYRIRKQALGDAQLVEAFMERRRGFYAAIVLRDPTQQKFSAGWRHRRNALRKMVGLDPEEA